PELKRLAAPFFQRFLERKDRMLQQLSAQNQVLRDQNYPAQVQMDEGALPLFAIENDERQHVSADDAKSLPVEKLSPSALLRPLFQDSLSPPPAHIAGPAEIAYFAQLHPGYETLEIEQCWLLARASLTLIPPPVQNFLQSRRMKPEELFMKEDTIA